MAECWSPTPKVRGSTPLSPAAFAFSQRVRESALLKRFTLQEKKEIVNRIIIKLHYIWRIF